jgi:diaphanous 1
MRVLNWQKMPNTKAEKTLFFQMKDELTQVQLDFGELQDMFRQPEDKSADKGAGGGGPVEPAKPAAVTLIGPKRTQSVNIFLKSSRMDAAEMMVALNKYDQSICTLEFLERLLDNIPTQEEISSIDAYLEGGGDAHLLAEPEKFFRDIHTIKGLKLKVQAFITLQKFPEQLATLKPQIELVRGALEQLKTSTKWKGIVRMVLAIGNYINGSSTRGDAMGFKLDSLNKLRDTKTTDNKSNLLNYLVSTLEKNEPGTLLVSEELKSIEGAKRVSFQTCSEDIQGLTKACANVEAATQVVVDDPNDKFRQFVTDNTARTFRGHLNTVVGELQAAEALYKELATAYGEDPATMPSGEFLGIVDTFLQSMLTARKDIEAARVKAAKAAAAAAVKSKSVKADIGSTGSAMPAAAEVPTLRESAAAAPKGAQPGQALVVDELLQGLKSGALLKARTENRREERIRRTPTVTRKDVNEPPPWMAGRGRGLGRGSPTKSEQARLVRLAWVWRFARFVCVFCRVVACACV